ncbi:Calpain-9 [Fusarium oxysporum f. sp. cubense race 1]|uniref:Calpain-9 n=1 Tax=Fusarium oxysporum f. sp. cubense (strain race 1) TaxID=1229664 RepID=N4UUY8_FUSC1|nr:Calpain-9 [Fusarium oxysporum f. sp. cubense race 1]
MKPTPPTPGQQPTPAKPKRKPLNPQALVSKFWSKYHSKAPGKVTSIFPQSLYESLLTDADSSYPKSRNAAQSYEDAAKECRARVRAIVRECERTNAKFSDPDFDIETDFSSYQDNCLNGLMGRRPGSVHRIPWIFENPQFTVGGFSSTDIKQGAGGDCWWLAALATIAHRKDLMKKICVAKDEECGVYGFVFNRDGEWISTVVDDNLYLKHKDFGEDTEVYDATGKKARLYKTQKQTGSESLYFAKCEDPNETWLPLLEKAFAKVHGDYHALDGGWSGTAVEDLTGGVNTVVAGNRVLRKERLWREMLGSDGEDGEFVFGLSAGGPGEDHNNGIVLRHAYSILKVAEVEDEDGNKVRLVKIRNPWGQKSEDGHGEWHGPWSDGSKQWTPHMIRKLRHQFGDDGIFWMSFSDMLDNFKWMYRTRLFDERWTVAQQWTSVSISWLTGYLKKKFIIEVKEEGMVVIVLSQLDERYFKDLKGQYEFVLHFLLKTADDKTPICSVRPAHKWDRRSINCEVELEPGTYEVIPKITAERYYWLPTVQKMVKMGADSNPQKLRQIGLQYDLAHAKGGIIDEDEALRKKKELEKKKKLKGKKQEKKKKQMAEAMASMEAAMVQMRNEYNRSLNEKDTEKEKSKKEKEKEKEEPTSKEEDEEEPSKKEDDTGAKPDKAPPGFWPEDSSKSDLQVSTLSETPTEPKGDPRTTMQSIDTNPVFTPPTEPTSESDFDSSDSASVSSSEPDDSSSSSDDDMLPTSLFPRLKQKKKQPWNAVCVIGLRVYAQHAGIKVRLADQRGDEATELVPPKGSPASFVS